MTKSKYEYSDTTKVAVNDLADQAHKFSTQTFPDTSLPYVYELQINDLIGSMSDEQVGVLLRKIMSELECRILGEHIAKANAASKRTQIEAIKQMLK